MHNFTGILTFTNNVFKAGKKAGQDGDPKFSVGLLFPPNDPQVVKLKAIVAEEIANAFPSGLPRNADLPCFATYNEKVDPAASYYDPRFADWYMLTGNAKEDQKPPVVGEDLEPLMNKAFAAAGMIGTVAIGIQGYVKGKGGVAGYFNGLMCTGEMGEMGDLTGRPSVKQMFAGAGETKPSLTKPSLAKAELVMTAAAEDVYAVYIEAGYTDAELIEAGLAEAPKPKLAPKLKPKLKPKLAPKAPENVMTSMADYTYQEYIDADYTREDMIAEGLLVG